MSVLQGRVISLASSLEARLDLQACCDNREDGPSGSLYRGMSVDGRKWAVLLTYRS